MKKFKACIFGFSLLGIMLAWLTNVSYGNEIRDHRQLAATLARLQQFESYRDSQTLSEQINLQQQYLIALDQLKTSSDLNQAKLRSLVLNSTTMFITLLSYLVLKTDGPQHDEALQLMILGIPFGAAFLSGLNTLLVSKSEAQSCEQFWHGLATALNQPELLTEPGQKAWLISQKKFWQQHYANHVRLSQQDVTLATSTRVCEELFEPSAEDANQDLPAEEAKALKTKKP